MRLDESFFKDKDTISLAKDLLGKKLVRETASWIISGIINEVEAYREDDEASHSYAWRKTQRNKYMFYPAGYLYVYFTYWMHHCINIVSERQDYGSAVLIRSVIAVDWKDLMIKNRNLANTYNLANLSNWPAKLCQSFSFDQSISWKNLFDLDSKIYLEYIWYDFWEIKVSQRIGISKAKDKKWRFYL